MKGRQRICLESTDVSEYVVEPDFCDSENRMRNSLLSLLSNVESGGIEQKRCRATGLPSFPAERTIKINLIFEFEQEESKETWDC